MADVLHVLCLARGASLCSRLINVLLIIVFLHYYTIRVARNDLRVDIFAILTLILWLLNDFVIIYICGHVLDVKILSYFLVYSEHNLFNLNLNNSVKYNNL